MPGISRVHDKSTAMKTNEFLYAVIGALVVALAWTASHFSESIALESIIGFGSVAAIVALAAIDYRVRLKNLFR